MSRIAVQAATSDRESIAQFRKYFVAEVSIVYLSRKSEIARDTAAETALKPFTVKLTRALLTSL